MHFLERKTIFQNNIIFIIRALPRSSPQVLTHGFPIPCILSFLAVLSVSVVYISFYDCLFGVKIDNFNVVSAEDVQGNEHETGFKDLIKFWKKHGIPIAKDLLSDMDEETGKTRVVAIGNAVTNRRKEINKC